MMDTKRLANIRIILVETTHPGNIGACARAMKTMGLSKLYLVAPKYFPDAKATARAAGADDLLANAKVVDTLEMAIADCHLVIGTSARKRTLPWPVFDPRICAEKLIAYSGQGEVAVVFGQERSGLSNAQLALCHYHLRIPANEFYSSLNLAAAVQVVTYELAMQAREPVMLTNKQLVSSQELALFYEHLEQVLIGIGFLDASNPKKLMYRLRRLFNRAQIEPLEMNILRGILSAIRNKSEKII